MLGKYTNSIFTQLNLVIDPDPWGTSQYDDDDDFGFANLEDDFEKWADDENLPPKVPYRCKAPQDHRFEKKLLLNLYYRECLFCGYSPEHDGREPNFSDIHKNFLEWEVTHKI